MNERIRNFLRDRREDGPCLVVDLDVIRENYTNFAKALPELGKGIGLGAAVSGVVGSLMSVRWMSSGMRLSRGSAK